MSSRFLKSLRYLLLAIGLASCGYARADQTVYSDSLQPGWDNWSWATVNLNSPVSPKTGSACIAVTCSGGYQAMFFHNGGFDSGSYSNLTFWINGGTAANQPLQLQAVLGGTGLTPYTLTNVPANSWKQFSVPLQALGVSNSGDMDGFWIQSQSGSAIPIFYVDDIVFVSGAPPPPPVIGVDVAANRRAISPEIYGLCFASPGDLVDLNSPLNRSGGNNTSRYNWQANADNRGSDWFFESIGYDSSTPGEVVDTFIGNTKSAGAQPMVTIPMLDWVAKLGSGRSKLASFSVSKYGAQQQTDFWMPDAGNGIRTNGQFVTGNDPNDANTPSTSTFQQGWVQHLTNVWHTATNGGVRYYLLDNESSIWYSTHRDVQPTGASMEQIRNKMIDYIGKIRAIDPNATIVGPEEWGWSGYLYSGLDLQTLATNGYSFAPDKVAHGNKDYLPWLLEQLRQTNLVTGKKLLDVFSVHYYPQSGEFGTDTSTGMQMNRNRSTRSLWDTNYIDPSWIQAKVMLIPRIKNWVSTYYPGLRTAITEYNWGAEDHMNGATAQADILGIFGREGLDIATRWTTPASTSPVYKAFKMYRNYDGSKSTFGDTSVLATVPNPDNVAVFAAQRTNDGALTVMVINKQLTSSASAAINFTNFTGSGTVGIWQLNTNAISHLPNATYANAVINMTFPAQSVTLLVIPPNAPKLKAGAARQDAQLDLWLNGETGVTYILQSSTNLTTWSSLSTNTLTSSQFHLLVPSTSTKTFYRAQRKS